MLAQASVSTRPPATDVAAVARLSWPIAISMLSYVAMGVTDTLFVGRLGTAPLAAIGLAVTQCFLATAAFTGTLEGVRVGVAHATGAGDARQADRFAWSGLALALVFGAVCAAWVPFGEAMFASFGTDPEVARLAATYFGWRILSAPLLFVGVALTGWLAGQGQTRSVMVAALLSNGVHIALDVSLVPSFGIAGAGIASAVAQAMSVAVLAIASRRLLARPSVPRWVDAARILRVGLPMGANHGLDVASYSVFALMLAGAGQAQLAAHVVAVRILSVSFLPGYAIGEAGGVLVGQAIGAGRPDRARAAFRSATLLAVGMMLLFGFSFAAAPSAWLWPFRVALDVEAVAIRVLMLAAAIQVFDAVATTALHALNGAGDTRFTLVVTVGAAWLVKLPVAGALVWLGWGAVGAWTGLAAEIVCLSFVLGLRIRGAGWLRAA